MPKPKLLHQYNLHWLDAYSAAGHYDSDDSLPTCSEFRGTMWLIAEHDDEYVFSSMLSNEDAFLNLIAIPKAWIVSMESVVEDLTPIARPSNV